MSLNDELCLGLLKIEPLSRRTFWNNREVRVTRLEFEVFYFLAIHVESVVRTTDILLEVWHSTLKGYGDSLHNVISRLRSKFPDVRIEARSKIGYILHVPAVEKAPAGAAGAGKEKKQDLDTKAAGVLLCLRVRAYQSAYPLEEAMDITSRLLDMPGLDSSVRQDLQKAQNAGVEARLKMEEAIQAMDKKSGYDAATGVVLLKTYITGACDYYASIVERKGLVIRQKFSGRKVIANEAVVKDLFFHIIGTAVKYSPLHGVIEVKGTTDEQHLYLHISGTVTKPGSWNGEAEWAIRLKTLEDLLIFLRVPYNLKVEPEKTLVDMTFPLLQGKK